MRALDAGLDASLHQIAEIHVNSRASVSLLLFCHAVGLKEM